MACSRSLEPGFVPWSRCRDCRGEHLGGKTQRIGHLAIRAPDHLGQVVRGDRVSRGAADEFLDPRLGIFDGSQGPDELGGVGDPPGGPDRDLDLSSVGGGHIDEFFGLVGPVPDLERLGQANHFLDQRQLEVESRLGPAGNRLSELEEHGQFPFVHGIEDGLAQGNAQDQEHADEDSQPATRIHLLASPFEIEVQERQELLEVGVDHGLVLDAHEQILHGLDVEPLAGDLGGSLIGVILDQKSLDLALASARRRSCVTLRLADQLVPRRPLPRGAACSASDSASFSSFCFCWIEALTLSNAGLTRSGGITRLHLEGRDRDAAGVRVEDALGVLAAPRWRCRCVWARSPRRTNNRPPAGS